MFQIALNALELVSTEIEYVRTVVWLGGIPPCVLNAMYEQRLRIIRRVPMVDAYYRSAN
jgi:hypothetical protein